MTDFCDLSPAPFNKDFQVEKKTDFCDLSPAPFNKDFQVEKKI